MATNGERLQREGMKWQPIETAPKSGGKVLVWDPEWDKYPAIAAYDAKYGRWADEDYDPDEDPRWHLTPTHWMPLPEPPKPHTDGPDLCFTCLTELVDGECPKCREAA